MKSIEATLDFVLANSFFIISICHTVLLSVMIVLHSPCIDEPATLASGYLNLNGWFDAYRVNPPMLRMIAAIPLMVVYPNLDFVASESEGFFRSEIMLSQQLAQQLGNNYELFIFLGRLCCIPFSLFGMYGLFKWVAEIGSHQQFPVS